MTFFGITFSNAELSLLGIAGSLAVIIISAVIYRGNAAIIKRREQKSELISTLLAPFNDAIVNIEHGEHNHIMIMNGLHAGQREAISRAKAIARKRAKTKIEAAWDDYDNLYQQIGEIGVVLQFAKFQNEDEKNQQEILRHHMDTIIKAIRSL